MENFPLFYAARGKRFTGGDDEVMMFETAENNPKFRDE